MTGIWSKPRRFLEIKEDKKRKTPRRKGLAFFPGTWYFLYGVLCLSGRIAPKSGIVSKEMFFLLGDQASSGQNE
jgi:hypothetical protein